tara:strand:- start:120 stop:284 length:165 start_codon:yes stop_codon:yes gene_type:complete
MAKVQVFLPEPPSEFSSESFRQINLALESLQNQLNTNYQKETKEEADAFSYFLQ